MVCPRGLDETHDPRQSAFEGLDARNGLFPARGKGEGSVTGCLLQNEGDIGFVRKAEGSDEKIGKAVVAPEREEREVVILVEARDLLGRPDVEEEDGRRSQSTSSFPSTGLSASTEPSSSP